MLAATTHLTTSGPAFNVHGWIAVVVIAGAVAASLIAVAGLLRLVLGFAPVRWMLRRLVSQPFTAWTRSTVGDIVSVQLEQLVHQLVPNGGSSIPDRLARIEASQHELSAHLTAQDRKLKTQDDKLNELHQYTHEWRHKVTGDMAAMRAAEASAEAALTELQSSLEKVREAQGAIASITTTQLPVEAADPV